MNTRPETPDKRNDKGQIPPDWLTQGKAAALLGVTPRQFQNYGIELAGRRGRYTYYTPADLLKFAEERAHRKGYEAGLRAGGLPEDAAALAQAREQAELALTRERAETQRLRNAEMRRELAPVEMLTWALSDLASQIVPIVNSIPGDLKRQNPKISNAELHTMREVIANALNLCAELRIDFDAYEDEAA